jgi:hypothetical protein
LQINRTCSTPDIGATGGAIGVALALVAANPASAAAEKRTTIGFPMEASLVELVNAVWRCWAEPHLNGRR